MDYSQATADLIERIRRNVERKSFTLEKGKAEECLFKTYDLFGLKRPSKVVWFVDIFDEKWSEICNKAESAESARSARLARSAWSTWSVESAESARSAESAESARSVESAWSARSVESAWSAWLALDYDFDWYVFEFEYCQNPDKNYPPNDNDKKYLEYCKLLMQAKEYGMGYFIEYEDTLYCVPTPLVRIDGQNRSHSEHVPAINWIGGKGLYFLHGVSFTKDLWIRLINRQVPMREILAIEDIDQRTQAIKYAKDGIRDFYKSQNGEMIDHYVKLDKEGRPINYELWRIPAGDVFSKTVHFAVYECPPAREKGETREYTKGVPEFKTVAEAMAWGMSSDDCIITSDEWKELVPLIDES